LDELGVVVLVSPGDRGEGVEGAEVLECFGVGAGEVVPVPIEERVLEVRVGWPDAEAEAYEVAEWEVGAGVLEVNEVEVSGWAEEPVAGLEVEVAGYSVRVGGLLECREMGGGVAEVGCVYEGRCPGGPVGSAVS
jgi:hypothetical protein